MELKDYIANVLEQIKDGINISNHNESDVGVLANPAFKNCRFFEGDNYVIDPATKSYRKIINVDFDVALSSTTSKEAGGKAGIQVIGIGGHKGTQESSTSRVKFSLPVIFTDKRDL